VQALTPKRESDYPEDERKCGRGALGEIFSRTLDSVKRRKLWGGFPKYERGKRGHTGEETEGKGKRRKRTRLKGGGMSWR